MSAERERGGRRAPSRLIRSLFAAVVITAIGLAPTTATAVADSLRSTTTGGGSTATTEGPALTLVAAPGMSGIARAGEPVTVRVTVTNPGDAAIGPVTVALSVERDTAADAERLAEWFAGTIDAATDTAIATATLSSLEPGASAVLDLGVANADAALGGELGARLAAVRASVGDAVIAIDRTALVWVPTGASPPAVGTTFVAAISTPGEPDGLLSAAVLERHTSETGTLSRTLDAVAGRPVLVGIDPRIIASIRALGDQAPASSIAFLARLEAAPNESFLLPWADADPTATITASSVPLPLPEGTGSPAAAATDIGASPSPSPEPSPPVVIDDLLNWPTTFEGVAWAEAATVTADAVPVLADNGTRVLIAPGSSLAAAEPVQRLGAVRVLRVDDALTSATRDASQATSQQRFDQAMARVSALLAAEAIARPGAPALIALNRDRLARTDRLVATIAQTVGLPWTAVATASEALVRAPVASSVIEPVVNDVRLDAVRGALAAETSDRVFATIAVRPEVITDLRRLELLAALSLGWGGQSSAALQAYVAESTALQSAVQVVQSSDILLLADRASLPVTVQNSLDVAVRVFVRVDPDSTQLRVLDQRVETVVEPQSQTRALVPVESLTNGQVDITVTVRDAESRVIGTPTRVALNLQAGWETAGTIAVAVALLVLLVVGITRDIRKRRRPPEDEE